MQVTVFWGSEYTERLSSKAQRLGDSYCWTWHVSTGHLKAEHTPWTSVYHRHRSWMLKPQFMAWIWRPWNFQEVNLGWQKCIPRGDPLKLMSDWGSAALFLVCFNHCCPKLQGPQLNFSLDHCWLKHPKLMDLKLQVVTPLGVKWPFHRGHISNILHIRYLHHDLWQ